MRSKIALVMAPRTGAWPVGELGRFRVAHMPTKTLAIGNWAVVRRSNQRIVSGHHTREAAARAAAAKGSARRRSRRAKGSG